jgi:hypothetical protein
MTLIQKRYTSNQTKKENETNPFHVLSYEPPFTVDDTFFLEREFLLLLLLLFDARFLVQDNATVFCEWAKNSKALARDADPLDAMRALSPHV